MKKQIIYYPSNTTALLYLDTATCFGHLQLLLGHEHSTCITKTVKCNTSVFTLWNPTCLQ